MPTTLHISTIIHLSATGLSGQTLLKTTGQNPSSNSHFSSSVLAPRMKRMGFEARIAACNHDPLWLLAKHRQSWRGWIARLGHLWSITSGTRQVGREWYLKCGGDCFMVFTYRYLEYPWVGQMLPVILLAPVTLWHLTSWCWWCFGSFKASSICSGSPQTVPHRTKLAESSPLTMAPWNVKVCCASLWQL